MKHWRNMANEIFCMKNKTWLLIGFAAGEKKGACRITQWNQEGSIPQVMFEYCSWLLFPKNKTWISI